MNSPEAANARAAEDARGHRSIGGVEVEADADGSPGDGVVDELAQRFVSGTVKAFGKQLLETAAAAHPPLSLAMKAAELFVQGVKWCRVAEGDGAVEGSAPIPLGDGVELQLSAHPADGQDGPPLTVCCAPSDESAVLVAQIGPIEVGPSTEPERADLNSGHAGEADVTVSGQPLQPGSLGSEHPDDAAGEAGGPGHSDVDLRALGRPFEIISADLSTDERVDSRLEGLVALKYAAQQELPQLRSRLRGRGTRLAVLCDLEIGRVLALRLDEDDDSSLPMWCIRIEVDPVTGRLSKLDVRQSG
jgi:hypothetical protein